MEQKPIWLIAAVLVFAGMIAWLVSSRDPGGNAITGGTPGAVARPAGSIPITIASSSTKKEWLDQAVASFNAAAKSDAGLQVNAKPVFVEVVLEELEPGKKDHYRSGSMVTDILSGKIKPTIASPAEESWIFKLNKEWQAANSRAIATGQAPGVARTPLVIAMWESRARALDCWPAPKP